jgi:hypothetical protein
MVGRFHSGKTRDWHHAGTSNTRYQTEWPQPCRFHHNVVVSGGFAMTKLTKVLIALLAAVSLSSLAVAAQSNDETSEQYFYKHTGGVPPQ